MASKIITAAAMSFSAAALLAAVPVHAAAEGTVYSTVLTTDDELKTTALNKYFVMKSSAAVPEADFTFTVTPGAAVDADTAAGKSAVLAGVGMPALKIGSGNAETDGDIVMTFTAGDTTVNEADKGTDTPVFVTDNETDEKYVKKTLVLDFSAVPFTEPGIYRYIITETGSNQAVTNGYQSADSTETKRTLDVYVEDAQTVAADGQTDAGKPQLKIAGYVMYNGEQTTAPNAAGNPDAAAPNNGAEVTGAVKNNNITNVYASQNLTFGKIVTGNQGSRDKYFKFTLTLSGIKAENTNIAVDVSRADPAVPAEPSNATKSAYAGKPNPVLLIADTDKTEETDGYTVTAVDSDEDGKTDSYTVTAYYYLQHGQYITVKGLPQGVSYALSEEAEDYSATGGITAALSTLNWDGADGADALSNAQSGKIQAADIYTGFTNSRVGTIPTGILSTVGGSAALAVFGIAGVAGGVLYLKKKKSEEEA